ncbi:hypothetical protein KQX54_000321 [Cotesia glomerata]|uniref:Uncharacterized protein n=1 Tax=Cotesia glomerata TaxID=32391 RepID=A0AAV7HUU9_COTGL|nr:hypothetical protein KQX54_000321 [Cotesia glomerata]
MYLRVNADSTIAAATDILMLDNESKGNLFYDMVLENPPNIMHDIFPKEMKFGPKIRLPVRPNKALINFIETCRLLNENLHN